MPCSLTVESIWFYLWLPYQAFSLSRSTSVFIKTCLLRFLLPGRTCSCYSFPVSVQIPPAPRLYILSLPQPSMSCLHLPLHEYRLAFSHAWQGNPPSCTLETPSSLNFCTFPSPDLSAIRSYLEYTTTSTKNQGNIKHQIDLEMSCF